MRNFRLKIDGAIIENLRKLVLPKYQISNYLTKTLDIGLSQLVLL